MSVQSQRAPVAPVTVEPFFLDSPHGPLFAVHHHPSAGRATRGHVLCVPPFNEEMNRCRSMITMQAQALGELGFGTLLIDLYGTGDSAGKYVDARWDIWLQNIRAGMAWLSNRAGGCRALWGIRLGAILAAETLRNESSSATDLILWQPIVDGGQYFTQFLRMRIAAQMDGTDLPKETTASMRAHLGAGGSVEVAGYEIHPQLAAALDAARLGDMAPPNHTRVLWLEQALRDSTEVSPASGKVLAAWRACGLNPEVKLFAGAAFWQLYERTVAPDIINATAHWARDTWGTA